jgi:GAF domain-containing protein
MSSRPAARTGISSVVPKAGSVSVVRRQRDLLADVTRALATVESVAGTLSRVGRLCLPEVAEMCIVDVISKDGEIRRAEVVHVDPSTAESMKEIKREFAPRSEHPVLEVFASGNALLVPEVTDDLLTRIARDPAHLVILRRFGPKSIMRVPMVMRGRTEAVLSFLITDSSRRFTGLDLEFAEEIVARVVAAFDKETPT